MLGLSSHRGGSNLALPMRIRKSQVPFPLSSQLADPHRISRSSVVVQLNDATTISPKPFCTHGSAAAPIRSSLDRPQQPSDQQLSPIGKPTDGCDGSSGEGGTRRRQQEKKVCLVEDEDWRGQNGGGGHKGNDTRKGCILGSEASLEAFPSSSPSKQDGRWCEGEKAIPLKKRRGDFHENMQENNSNNDNNIKNKKMNRMKARMKMEMNKEQECSVQVDDIVKEEEADGIDEEKVVRETKPDGKVSKRRVTGGALMAGSRCSRVNGRGWRCCQQTLVGYSLCEHHLGKGRLRSMTSVRSRSIASTTTTSTTSTSSPKKLHRVPLSKASSSSSSPHEEKETKSIIHHDDPLGNDSKEYDETKPLMATKKRMKLGTVKARSMSSLLGQTNIEIAVQENNK